MKTQDIVKTVKVEAFDAMMKAFKANDSYYKRTDAILAILAEADKMIREAKANG